MKLSDQEIERLLSNLDTKAFASRDEEEVAGYAEVMETVFSNWRDIPLSPTPSRSPVLIATR